MKIIINREPPPAFVKIIHEEAEGIETIETILFDSFFFDICMPAGFEPRDKEIVMDLGHCLMSPLFIKQGMMHYPGIWFNLLWAFHHEVYHAKQLLADPKLVEWEGLPPALEHEAEQYAANKVTDWCLAGGKIPEISEMGWMGQRVKDLINANYHTSLGDRLIRELEATKAGAVADVRNVISLDFQAVREKILDGEIGVVIEGIAYLTAAEFFGAQFCTIGRDGAQCRYEAPRMQETSEVRLLTAAAGGVLG